MKISTNKCRNDKPADELIARNCDGRLALYDVISWAGERKLTKIRVCENGKSYEDFSISYTLYGKPVYNLMLEFGGTDITIKKMDKRSTRHVQFRRDLPINIWFVRGKSKYLKIDVIGEVRYTDGTHRYKKDAI